MAGTSRRPCWSRQARIASSGVSARVWRWGRWLTTKEEAVSTKYIEELSIKSGTVRITCDQLSGGNQQKVVLSRWLCRHPKLLVLDNPTRGIDVGAKEEIYQLLFALATRGIGIIVISSEFSEVLRLSDRTMVMRDGGSSRWSTR